MRLLRILGLAAVLAGIPAGMAPAGAVGEELGGWNAAAAASAYTVFPAIPTLIPYDAPVEATVSLTQATLSTGGAGFGRASTVWPGVLAGLAPLMKLLAPDAPPLPDYPIVVESRDFEDPKRTEQAGMVMSSDVTPERAVVEAVAASHGAEGLFTIGGASSISTSTAGASSVTAESTARVTDIALAAGQVTIDEVATRSTATSDGVHGSCDGDARVSGLMIGGVPATVDDSGVHAADQNAELPVDPNGVIAGVLGATGVQLRVIGGIGECDGPIASRSTGGLLISMPLPAGGPVPPGGTLNLIIGSSAVAVEAVPAPSFVAVIPPADLPPVVPVGAPTSPSSIGAPVALPSIPAGEGTLFSPIDDDRPAAYEFGGVPASMVVGALLLAFPATRRVRRYAERVIALAGT